MSAPASTPVEDRWRGARAGERYGGTRWRGRRAAERDPRLVQRALIRQRCNLAQGYILDIPCGTGRLRSVLEATGARYVGVDVSPAMLAEGTGPGRLRGSARALPFRDGAFDAVVCCRLLHHLTTREERAALVAELVRVSRDLVVVSWWDARSLHAWRRRAGLRHAPHRDPRVAVPRRELEAAFQGAGAAVVDALFSLRFVSQQAFLVARKRGAARA